jgi:hypothetical protein
MRETIFNHGLDGVEHKLESRGSDGLFFSLENRGAPPSPWIVLSVRIHATSQSGRGQNGRRSGGKKSTGLSG